MAGKKSRERSIPTEYYFYRNIGSHGYFSSLSSCEDSFARFYRNLPCNSSRANPFPLRWKLSRVHPSTTRERDEDEDDSSLSLPLPSSPALSLSFPAGGKFGESRKRATLNGANRRCRAAKGCRLKGKQFSWKQLTADWRERRRGEGGEGGGSRERHLTIDARVAATRERSYICPTMKIEFWESTGQRGVREGGSC